MKQTTKFPFVLICLLMACNSHSKSKPLTNDDASIPASLKSSISGMKMMTSFINKKGGSMSVLYAGSNTRSLVTWKQKTDDNWFGGNIPGRLLSIETVKIADTTPGRLIDYKTYNGQGLRVTHDTAWQNRRGRYILAQQPSIMP